MLIFNFQNCQKFVPYFTEPPLPSKIPGCAPEVMTKISKHLVCIIPKVQQLVPWSLPAIKSEKKHCRNIFLLLYLLLVALEGPDNYNQVTKNKRKSICECLLDTPPCTAKFKSVRFGDLGSLNLVLCYWQNCEIAHHFHFENYS